MFANLISFRFCLFQKHESEALSLVKSSRQTQQRRDEELKEEEEEMELKEEEEMELKERKRWS